MASLVSRSLGGLGVASLLLAASCAPIASPPEQVDADAPSVTYKYNSDNDLVATYDKARVYCAQYQAVPSVDGTVVEEADGSKRVTYQCLKTMASSPPMSAPPAMPPAPRAATYSTDAELLQAVRQADAYCMQSGQRVSSSIVTNVDGSRTVTFQCVPG